MTKQVSCMAAIFWVRVWMVKYFGDGVVKALWGGGVANSFLLTYPQILLLFPHCCLSPPQQYTLSSLKVILWNFEFKV